MRDSSDELEQGIDDMSVRHHYANLRSRERWVLMLALSLSLALAIAAVGSVALLKGELRWTGNLVGAISAIGIVIGLLPIVALYLGKIERQL